MPELLESLNNLYGPTAGQYLLNTNGASTQQQKPMAFLQHNLTKITYATQIVTTAGPNVYYLYGSSRLGEQKHFAGKSNAQTYHQQHGSLTYEFTDHLGNIKLTTNNRLKLHYRNTAYHLEPTLLSSLDYYAFGMVMPGRSFSSGEYRYGFQGQERDDEIRGAGNSLNYKYRMADVRLGRFFAIDPLFKDYPHNSSYAFSENRVIDGVELEGLEYVSANIFVQNGKVIGIQLVDDYDLKNKHSQGPGFQRNYVYFDEKGNQKLKVYGTKSNGGFVENIYGLYGGPENPQLPEIGGDPFDLKDNYDARSVDEADEIFKQHDKDFDIDKLKGEEGVDDPQSTPYNNAVIDRADKLIDSYIKGDRNDIITGEPIKTKTAAAAGAAKIYFQNKENQKSEGQK